MILAPNCVSIEGIVGGGSCTGYLIYFLVNYGFPSLICAVKSLGGRRVDVSIVLLCPANKMLSLIGYCAAKLLLWTGLFEQFVLIAHRKEIEI